MWLFFALLSPMFWAIVHVLDAHCVDRVFDKPWMGVITSSLTSLLIVLCLSFVLPFGKWSLPESNIFLLALLAGTLIQISQIFYFQALDYSEAGIVAAYWNLTPALVPFASFLFWGKVLAGWEYLGIGVIVIASVCFCLFDSNLKTSWMAFWLMLIASCLQVNVLLLESEVFKHCDFLIGFWLITLGISISGTLPLMFSRIRSVFRKNLLSLQSAIPIILGIEIANLLALFMSQRAISLGVPSLVAAVEATVPAYTFALSIILLTFNSSFGEPQVWHRFPIKLGLTVLMAVGVRMVA